MRTQGIVWLMLFAFFTGFQAFWECRIVAFDVAFGVALQIAVEDITDPGAHQAFFLNRRYFVLGRVAAEKLGEIEDSEEGRGQEDARE